MSQPSIQIPANSSRLVRSLAELCTVDAAVSHEHFAERLGQMFDLPDSIKISAVHGKTLAVTLEPPAVSRETVKAEFLRVRAGIVSSVLRSFVPGSGAARLRFPATDAATAIEETMAPEPYLAFYMAQQRDIEFRVRNLQAVTRDALAGFSPRLAQLVALDSAIGDPLSAHARRLFTAVPRLLQQRFELLLEEYRQAISGQPHAHALREKALGQFREEMQGLLLAEIETRLLPTLGLIEALNEHESE